jgi:hypothetical protein
VGRIDPSGDTKLQQFATINGGSAANAVTACGIHDNVIAIRFSAPDFYTKTFRFQRKRCFRPERFNANRLHFSRCEGSRDDLDLE